MVQWVDIYPISKPLTIPTLACQCLATRDSGDCLLERRPRPLWQAIQSKGWSQREHGSSPGVASAGFFDNLRHTFAMDGLFSLLPQAPGSSNTGTGQTDIAEPVLVSNYTTTEAGRGPGVV